MDVGLPLLALADPRRRSLYELLQRAPASVRELTDQLPISQPAVSQHLKVLAAAKLVSSQPDGAKRIYTADPAGLVCLRGWIDLMWNDVLDHFDEATKNDAKT